MDAPIGLVETTVTLPYITMVFCSVDGGKVFATKSRSMAKDVHSIIASVVRSVLRQVRRGSRAR